MRGTEKTNMNIFSDQPSAITPMINNPVPSVEKQENKNRNSVNYYQSNFPQLPIIAYGVVNTEGGTTAVFDEFATTPLTQVKHQPDYTSVGAWAVSRAGVGSYLLTHNLGHVKYIPNISTILAVTPVAVAEYSFCQVGDAAMALYFTDTATGSLADPDGFSFIIQAVPE